MAVIPEASSSSFTLNVSPATNSGMGLLDTARHVIMEVNPGVLTRTPVHEKRSVLMAKFTV